MGELVGLVYLLNLERLERWTMVRQLAAASGAIVGQRSDAPSFAEAKAEFDAWLDSPLVDEEDPGKDPQQRELEAALGV